MRPGPASTPSIISADLVVNGSLTSVGDIQIDGRVEGDVRGAGLVVGDKALIHGEVYGEDITVRGRIEGGIRARKVLLCSGCHVEGNILHEAFAVETGAFFEGNCRHSDHPLAEPQPRRASAEFANRPAPAPVASPAMPTAGSPGLTAVARPLNDSNGGAARSAPISKPS
jgi:cytoskeletal protein CcmA (bactofilin family)